MISRVKQNRGGWGQRLAIGWVVGVAGIPVILLLVWSMAWSWFWPRLLPQEWSGRAWQSLFSPASGLWESLRGSLGIATGVALSALAIGMPAARVLARPSFPARRFLLYALLLPVIAPPLASTMGMHALFLRYGLADTYLGVGLAHRSAHRLGTSVTPALALGDFALPSPAPPAHRILSDFAPTCPSPRASPASPPRAGWVGSEELRPHPSA